MANVAHSGSSVALGATKLGKCGFISSSGSGKSGWSGRSSGIRIRSGSRSESRGSSVSGSSGDHQY